MTKSRAPFAATVAAALIAAVPAAAAAQEIRLAQAAGSERVPGGVEHRPTDSGSMAPGSVTDGASRSAPRRAVAPPTLGATGGAAPPAAPAAPADAKKAPKEDATKK